MATALQQLFGKTSGNALLDKKVAKAEREAVGGDFQDSVPPAPAPDAATMSQSQFGGAKNRPDPKKTKAFADAMRRHEQAE